VKRREKAHRKSVLNKIYLLRSRQESINYSKIKMKEHGKRAVHGMGDEMG